MVEEKTLLLRILDGIMLLCLYVAFYLVLKSILPENDFISFIIISIIIDALYYIVGCIVNKFKYKIGK